MPKDKLTPYDKLASFRKPLVDSPDPKVRKCAAEMGLGLDKLVNDPNAKVRLAVAKKGFGLDKLYLESYDYISKSKASDQIYAVEKWLQKHHMNLAQWRKKNPHKCIVSQSHPEFYQVYRLDMGLEPRAAKCKLKKKHAKTIRRLANKHDVRFLSNAAKLAKLQRLTNKEAMVIIATANGCFGDR